MPEAEIHSFEKHPLWRALLDPTSKNGAAIHALLTHRNVLAVTRHRFNLCFGNKPRVDSGEHILPELKRQGLVFKKYPGWSICKVKDARIKVRTNYADEMPGDLHISFSNRKTADLMLAKLKKALAVHGVTTKPFPERSAREQ